MVVLRRGLGAERRLHSLGIGKLQGPVHLVGRYVVEALAVVAFGQALPVHLGSLQERERAHDVGAGKGERVFDAAVHMALGRKVYDAVHPIPPHEPEHGVEVADVGPDECVVGPAFDILQVGQVAGVGQFVDIYDVILTIFVDEQAHHM